MTYREIRQKFIDYSVAHGHKLLPPAPLVPTDNDPTVLFTVAGMQQFKSYYQHPDDAPSPRIVTVQPCIRTIDIDEVGDDTHATVFEMLGHFSFGYQGETKVEGPYFKHESIRFGWEFLTLVLEVAPERISARYFGGGENRPADDESREFLNSIEGLSLIEADSENFWGPVGEEGPCGPNTEFYVDGIEVWNSVFNEFFKDKDGAYVPLDFKGIDMGTGFERVVMALQQKGSIYETDLLEPFLAFVKDKSFGYQERNGRIIVDHVKAALFLLADGVKPGNKGRDYILRRLIRRATREGSQTGFKSYEDLLSKIALEYETFYPHIKESLAISQEIFAAEQEKFLRSLHSGMKQLQEIMQGELGGEITGEQAFKLFDTHGFPVELTQEIAHEAGWTVDLDGFHSQLSKHRELSRAGIEKIFKGGLADNEPQTVAHHTAHHLLLAALRQVLGSHVLQRGSNVTSERLRIDVSHGDKITDEQLEMISDIVNQKIEEDLPVVNEIMDRDEAIKHGALAEFGTKYPKEVSVYTVIDQHGEPFSRELCGGPHVTHTGELGRFEILKEEASSAGIRRIRARVIPGS